jgi:hypothetical protein
MNKIDEIIQSFKDCGFDKDTSLRLALITVHRIIRVYDDEICGFGYDYDQSMWEAKQMEWVEILSDLTLMLITK